MRILLVVFCLALGGALAASPAHADNNFKKKHPRRAQVGHREKHQQKRIANGIKSGKMSASEAAQVESEEAALKAQKRAMVQQNGGHLTRKEQKQLNKEQNQISNEIYQDKHN